MRWPPDRTGLPDVIAYPDLRIRYLFQPGDDTQKGGLATARGAEQGGHPLVRQPQIHMHGKTGARQREANVHQALTVEKRRLNPYTASSITNDATSRPPAKRWARP